MMSGVRKILVYMFWGVALESPIIAMVGGGFLVLSSFISLTILSIGLRGALYKEMIWAPLTLLLFFYWGMWLVFAGESRS